MDTIFITKRVTAGMYEVTMKGDPDKRVVSITRSRYSDGPGWVAAAGWTRDVYSDPRQTKHEAVQCAIQILKSWTAEGKYVEIRGRRP